MADTAFDNAGGTQSEQSVDPAKGSERSPAKGRLEIKLPTLPTRTPVIPADANRVAQPDPVRPRGASPIGRLNDNSFSLDGVSNAIQNAAERDPATNEPVKSVYTLGSVAKRTWDSISTRYLNFENLLPTAVGLGAAYFGTKALVGAGGLVAGTAAAPFIIGGIGIGLGAYGVYRGWHALRHGKAAYDAMQNIPKLEQSGNLIGASEQEKIAADHLADAGINILHAVPTLKGATRSAEMLKLGQSVAGKVSSGAGRAMTWLGVGIAGLVGYNIIKNTEEGQDIYQAGRQMLTGEGTHRDLSQSVASYPPPFVGPNFVGRDYAYSATASANRQVHPYIMRAILSAFETSSINSAGTSVTGYQIDPRTNSIMGLDDPSLQGVPYSSDVLQREIALGTRYLINIAPSVGITAEQLAAPTSLTDRQLESLFSQYFAGRPNAEELTNRARRYMATTK